MENIALEAEKQKLFLKSIKGIKKLIKKDKSNIKKGPVEKTQDGIIKKSRRQRRKKRGLVYLSHIPHGFYENEMTQYFKQFGVVTNARVIRSKRTGRSKGYAFVEFKEPAVGQIVAETMNNYLMGKRLIKAAYIPPEKQRPHALRKHWNSDHNPGRELQLKLKKAYNENKDETGNLKKARKLLTNLSRTKKKLAELNINYDFFQPVDIPDALKKDIEIKEEEKESVENVKLFSKDERVSKSKNKPKKEVTVATKIKKEPKQEANNENRIVEVKHKKSNMDIKESKKKKKQNGHVDPKQADKQKKLKEADVKLLEDFIKVQQHSDNDSDSDQFDSDEYDKLIENDSEEIEIDSDESGNGSDKDVDNPGSDHESSDEELTPPKKGKVKSIPMVQPPTKNKKQKKRKKVPQKMEMVMSQKNEHAPKKLKCEKQAIQKPMKKRFKKKK